MFTRIAEPFYTAYTQESFFNEGKANRVMFFALMFNVNV